MIFLFLSCVLPDPAQSATPTDNPCTTPSLAFGEHGAWKYGVAVKVYSGGKKKEAADAVQAEAQADLKSKVCTQTLTETECDSLLGNRYLGRNTPYFDETTKQVCATVGIPQSILDAQTPERVTAEAEIDRAIQNLRLKLAPDATVDVLPVQSMSGCAVPELDVLAQRVRAGLSGVSLKSGADLQVVTLVSMQGGNVTASFELRQGESTQASVAADFPGALYSLASLPSLCREDAALGLYGGRRQGSVGLTLSTDLVDSGVCTGEVFNISASTTAPARVHVFSVAPDGQAWHIWPELPGDIVSGTRLLTAGTVAPIGAGDESLVAVAVPEGVALWDNVAGFCKLKEPFSSKLYPASAAVSKVTWHVETQECPPVTDPMLKAENIAVALQSAPSCM